MPVGLPSSTVNTDMQRHSPALSPLSTKTNGEKPNLGVTKQTDSLQGWNPKSRLMAPRIDPTNEIRVMNKNSTRRLTRNVSKRVTESSPGLSSHKQAKQGSNDAIVEQLMGSAELLKKQNKVYQTNKVNL